MERKMGALHQIVQSYGKEGSCTSSNRTVGVHLVAKLSSSILTANDQSWQSVPWDPGKDSPAHTVNNSGVIIGASGVYRILGSTEKVHGVETTLSSASSEPQSVVVDSSEQVHLVLGSAEWGHGVHTMSPSSSVSAQSVLSSASRKIFTGDDRR